VRNIDDSFWAGKGLVVHAGDAAAGVLDAQILPARRGPADLQPDLAALRRELDRVGEQIEHDLADGALVAPYPRHAVLEHFVDGDAAAGGAQLQQMVAELVLAVNGGSTSSSTWKNGWVQSLWPALEAEMQAQRSVECRIRNGRFLSPGES